MPRKAKNLLFGVFDEQAISVLAAIGTKELNFASIGKRTRMPKASVFRVLRRLEEAGFVQKTSGGYGISGRGEEMLAFVQKLARRQSDVAMRIVSRRLREMEREYRRERRLFHRDLRWERTAEKPLVEVMAVRDMTSLGSLLFHQRFQVETRDEEQALRRGSQAKG